MAAQPTLPSERHLRSGIGHPRGVEWLVVGFALAAGGLVLLSTRNGPSVVEDSTTYLSAALNLGSGRYRDFTLEPLTNFPPGLPALLVVGDWLGASAETAARFVNAASMAAVVLLTWILVGRVTRSRFLSLAATAFVACSINLLHLSDKVLAESLFLAFVLAFLLALDTSRHAAGGTALAWCGGAGAIVGLAFLVRYAAISLLVTGVLVLLLCGWRTDRRRAVARTGVLAGAAAPFFALWVARNATSGAEDLLGPRVPHPQSATTIVRAAARGIGAVFVPEQVAGAFCVVLVPGIVVALWYAARARQASGQEGREPWAVVPLGVFLVVYVVFAVVSYRFAGASLDARVLAPIYVPMIVIIVAAADELSDHPRVEGARSTRRLAVAAVVACLFLLAGAAVVTTWTDGRSPRGFAATRRAGSELAAVVRRLPDSALVASNSPHFLWYASEHQPIVRSPGVAQPGSNPRPVSPRVLERHACENGQVYLAWFRPPVEGVVGLDRLTELTRRMSLRQPQRVGDGILYNVRPRGGC